MKKLLFQYAVDKDFLAAVGYAAGRLLPATGRMLKYRNILAALSAINNRDAVTSNMPVRVRIAPISVCNYRCLFCEIHKDNILYPDRSRNIFTMDDLQAYEHMLSHAYNLSFYGGSEEPLLNKYFGSFVAYLKKKYGMRMAVTTNASVLSKELADIFVEYGFDTVLISYHAGTAGTYKELMTGDIEKVNRNIAYLARRKLERNRKKPAIDLNFALHKKNAGEYREILGRAKEFGARYVQVNRYYGGRNRLQDKKVSFEYDTENGNLVLDDIYRAAADTGVRLQPARPRYWRSDTAAVQWNPEDVDTGRKCYEPWLSIHFNPVLDDENCHYVGVCNRAELFKVNYRKADLGRDGFQAIWNHPVLQYLRKTVHSPAGNALCRFCKNRKTGTLRNVDEKQYAMHRDTAITRFFEECAAGNVKGSPMAGVEVLTENPHSDRKYQDVIELLEREASGI